MQLQSDDIDCDHANPGENVKVKLKNATEDVSISITEVSLSQTIYEKLPTKAFKFADIITWWSALSDLCCELGTKRKINITRHFNIKNHPTLVKITRHLLHCVQLCLITLCQELIFVRL